MNTDDPLNPFGVAGWMDFDPEPVPLTDLDILKAYVEAAADKPPSEHAKAFAQHFADRGPEAFGVILRAMQMQMFDIFMKLAGSPRCWVLTREWANDVQAEAERLWLQGAWAREGADTWH